MALLDNERAEEILLVIGDSFQGTNKRWLLALATVLIAALPGYFVCQTLFYNLAVAQYRPPAVTGLVERAPLEILEKELIKFSGNSYTGYVKLKNSNLDWGVPNLVYRVEIRSSDGTLITSSTNESFILPASEKYLVLPRFTSSATPTQVDFSVINSNFVLKPENFPSLNLEMQRMALALSGNETVVSAVIKNNSPFTVTQVDLLVTIHNERAELVGINYTNINDLLSGELRSFQISWPSQIPGRLVAEISPEVNMFARGILKTQGSVSPFDGQNE
jgi:hypothetical protein